jgi:hypothetical protein
MRGSNTLFSDIFIDEKPVEKQAKGRSANLNDKRNELLINRYYYYGLQKFRYDFILDKLSEEFFLSVVTIPKVIDENYLILHNLKKEQPSKQLLQKKWPHLVW